MSEALFAVLLALSLIPPLLYALYLRSREQHDREPVKAVLGAFLWGGTIGVAVALLLHILFEFGYHQAGGPLSIPDAVLAAVVAAPIVEEIAKALGLRGARRHISELEDGIIYGTALGLGFAASENLVYGIAGLLEGGFSVAISTVVVRTFSSMLLHAAATGLLGFGYSRMVLSGGVVWSLLPFYIAAVGLHALYNFLVGTEALLGLALGIVMVAVVMGMLRRRIEALDALPHELR